MAARHVGRAVGWAAACCALPVVLGATLGPRWGGLGVVAAIDVTAGLLLYLPRTAHAMFEAGHYRSAGRRYQLIAVTAFTPRRERTAQLSRAGCDVAGGRLDAAAARLARFDAASLDTSERVTWLNNRACVALDAGGDPAAALVLADEALALRPDVPAVQHTRATALLALGRADEAIGLLEAMRAGGELASALEALRCRELARAWEHKGQPDYAADYRDRARLLGK